MVGRDLKANKQSLKLANIESNENGLIKGLLKVCQAIKWKSLTNQKSSLQLPPIKQFSFVIKTLNNLERTYVKKMR